MSIAWHMLEKISNSGYYGALSKYFLHKDNVLFIPLKFVQCNL